MRLLLKFSTMSAVLLLAACGAPSEEPSSSPDPAGVAVLAEGDDYSVSNYAFTPLTVSPGQLVEVVDNDAEPHTLTATDGSFDTGSFDTSSPGTFTAPDTPGTYPFVCEIHPSMTGTLTVQ